MLYGKEGWDTYTEPQLDPSVAYCPSACSCGDSGLENTSKRSSQESSLALGGGGTLLGTVPCWISRMARESMALQSLQEGGHKASTVVAS